jgi:DNA-binding winged helix-turn-helix (wHTH) protein
VRFIVVLQAAPSAPVFYTHYMEAFMVADWRVRPDLNLIERAGQTRRLEPRLIDLLVNFATHPREVFSIDRIIRERWHRQNVSDSAVQSAISELRKSLDDDPRRPRIIETIPKRGYRLIASTDARPRLLAVLPFAVREESADTGIVRLGLLDLLISAFGRVRGLRVVARETAMRLAGRNDPVTAVSELGADWVLSGKISGAAPAVFVSVELADRITDKVIWRDRRIVHLDHLSRQARELVDELAAVLETPHTATTAPGAETHPASVVAYLRGRYHWYRLAPDHIEQAKRYFEEALRIDPGHAAAHAGMADVWGAQAFWCSTHPKKVRHLVQTSALAAERCDPDSPEAHMLLGAYAIYFEHDWTEGEARLVHAIELNPSLAHARLQYALFLAMQRRPLVRDEIDLAISCDPLNPALAYLSAMWSAYEGDDRQAGADIDLALELAPEHPPATQLRADLAWRRGSREAMPLERAAWASHPLVSQLLASTDGPQALGLAADTLNENRAVSYVAPLQIARLQALSGQTSRAIETLQNALADDDLLQIDLLQLTPAWDPLRGKPGFREVLDGIGLPP